MGFDTVITLPATARVQDVARVIGRCAGLPGVLEPLSPDAVHAVVKGVEVQNYPDIYALVTCVRIMLKESPHIGEIMYHFEGEGGTHILMPRSTPFAIVLARRLVDFFGGYVDYQDCDASESDYAHVENPLNQADDGEDWNNLQRAIVAVEPISEQEIKQYAQFAAYH